MKKAAVKLGPGVREVREPQDDGRIRISYVGRDGLPILNSTPRYVWPDGQHPQAQPSTTRLVYDAERAKEETEAQRTKLRADQSRYKDQQQTLKDAKQQVLEYRDLAERRLQNFDRELTGKIDATIDTLLDDPNASIDELVDAAGAESKLRDAIKVYKRLEAAIANRITQVNRALGTVVLALEGLEGGKR